LDPRPLALLDVGQLRPGLMFDSAQRKRRAESKLQRGLLTANGVESVKNGIEVTKEESL
jgi:hypothetical protein